MKRLFISLISIFSIIAAYGQSKTEYNLEASGSMSSGEHTPFWMVNHSWGIIPNTADYTYTRGGVFHQSKLNKDWSLEAGIDIIQSPNSKYGDVWLQQLYGRVNWKIFRLDIGSREDYVSFLDPNLSSGDFVYSNNARPIPQIKGSIPEFWLVPGTKGNFFLKGEFSIGKYLDGEWLEDWASPFKQKFTKDVMFNYKSIYFRLGDIEKRHKMQFTVGMSHMAQWGGSIYDYNPTKESNWEWQWNVHKQPEGFDDFLRVMIGKEGSSKASERDQVFVSGSHWGAYFLKYDYKFTEKDRVSVYIQHFFEDGTGMGGINGQYKDNLYGLEYKRKEKSYLTGAVLEFIYTKNQSGPIHNNLLIDDDHKDYVKKAYGADNYYNNGDYVQGPSHYGKSIGTPLFLSPEYNKDGRVNFQSNRIVSFHLGLEGYLFNNLQYRLLATTGRSWGRYSMPYTKVQKGATAKLELIYYFPKNEGLDFKLELGCDYKEFFGGKTMGGAITLRKRGILFERK